MLTYADICARMLCGRMLTHASGSQVARVLEGLESTRWEQASRMPYVLFLMSYVVSYVLRRKPVIMGEDRRHVRSKRAC